MKRFHSTNHGGHLIARPWMPANREERPSLIREMRRSEFGLYRPLYDRSYNRLAETAMDTVEYVAPELKRRRIGKQMGEFVIKDKMAVTYLKERDVRRKKIGLFLAGFRFKQDSDRLQEGVWQPKDKPLTVELDLDHMAWTDYHGRSLAVFLDQDSEGFAQLDEEADLLAEGLGRYSDSVANYVQTPNHVVLLKYGKGKEENKLCKSQKRFVIESLREQMEAKRIFTVELNPISAGKGYDTPNEHWANSYRKLEQLTHQSKIA